MREPSDTRRVLSAVLEAVEAERISTSKAVEWVEEFLTGAEDVVAFLSSRSLWNTLPYGAATDALVVDAERWRYFRDHATLCLDPAMDAAQMQVSLWVGPEDERPPFLTREQWNSVDTLFLRDADTITRALDHERLAPDAGGKP